MEEEKRLEYARVEKERLEKEVELIKQKNESIRLQREEEERNRLIEEKKREEEARTFNGTVYNSIEEANAAKKELEEKEREIEERTKKHTLFSWLSFLSGAFSIPLTCTYVGWIPTSIACIVLGIIALKTKSKYKTRVIFGFVIDGLTIAVGIYFLVAYTLLFTHKRS